MFKKIVILLCLVLAQAAHSLAQQDSIRVTLLTCSPGQEVYSLYGHTAIRCQMPEKGFDVVFNYGVFDMSKPHFAFHFVLGQTDYMVQPIPWHYFTKEYEVRGSSITEQELNLTPAEAHKLTSRLIENSAPENCNYRYNFLYKNCTTMVRDMVEQAITGSIQYPDTLPHLTARQILHHYTAGHPWAQEGNDLLLGAETDTILSDRAAMFIPENLMQACDGAYIRTPKGDMRPLIKGKQVLLDAKPNLDSISKSHKDSATFLEEIAERHSPMQAMLAFAALCLIIMLLEVWSKRLFWLWDVLLLLLQGTAGTLLTFMFLFSEHPAVDSNWQIWVLNPIAFIGIPLVIKAALRHQTTHWYAFQFALLALFLLFSPWIPQVFAKITLPLALCLLTRPASYHLVKRKSKKQRVKNKSK